MSGRKKLRCAVYTRKSTEEGLDQDFNSLDAQREACAAFIASQTGLGWSLVPDLYDDGGISGGTMDRPALQRLLQDIRDRRIDVVVVYKIDRLTRALMDFSRIVEIFDASNVSFVSVTQQFNTTTSMGRLTLNVLLSFAQFEREVTAERIRDKIAASKKKGMWMGGRVPLGYRVIERKLVIDEIGAERVRHLFRRYLDLRSVTLLAKEANPQAETGDPSSTRPCRRPMSRGQLYHLLSNPIYIGKLRHRGQVYDGEHQAILDPDLFARVQALLAGQAPNRKSRKNAQDVHLLTGLLFDETGDRLSPAHASKHGKRYRYYVSARLKTGDGNEEGGWRIAAAELERVVGQQLREILEDRTRLTQWIREEASSDRIALGLAAAERMIPQLETPDSSDGCKTILRTAFRRITVSPTGIRFVIDHRALVQHILGGEGSACSGTVSQDDGRDPNEGSVIDRTITIKRRGVEARIVVENGNGYRAPDRPLVDLVARAHLYLDRLTGESHPTIQELAGQLSVHPADISRVLPLAFLSPAITDAILTGRQPSDLTARMLARLIDLPPLWTDQAVAIGL